MIKILMICLGNICRSPMAEGIMKSKIMQHGLNAEVDSCGTANYHVGDSPDYRAQKTLKNQQIDISSHLGRQFQVEDFDKFDFIYTMDESNHNNILALARNAADQQKVKMILDEIYPGKNLDVPDPYYGSLSDFQSTFNLLDEACDAIVDKVKKLKV
jgi:protein-tyrosine phosphatase